MSLLDDIGRLSDGSGFLDYSVNTVRKQLEEAKQLVLKVERKYIESLMATNAKNYAPTRVLP